MPLPRRQSEPGPILSYLSGLRAADGALADKVMQNVRTMLQTPEGAMFLELLDNSTSLSLVPILADSRALEARNAQAFIAADLRRIMSDEHEQLLQRAHDAGSTRRRLTSPAGSRD